MTKEEAYILLNITSQSGTEEIDESYKRFYNDYKIRLTNAPTPNLKRLYQKNLNDLEQAVLILKGNVMTNIGELPSSEPVYTGFNDANAFEHIPPVAVKNEKPAAKPTPVKTGSRSGAIAYFFAVIGIAAAALFGILYSQQTKSFEKATTGLAGANQLLSMAARQLADFKNGKFVILNAGKTPIKIKDYIVIYRADDGSLKQVYGSPDKEVKPGARESELFKKTSGTFVEWDGSVIFYSISVTSANGDAIFADTWNRTAKNGILYIDMGNPD